MPAHITSRILDLGARASFGGRTLDAGLHEPSRSTRAALAVLTLALLLVACGPAATEAPENPRAGPPPGRDNPPGDGGALPPAEVPGGPDAAGPGEVEGTREGEGPGWPFPGAQRGSGPDATKAADALQDRLAHLQALPYVEYDPNADVSLLGVVKHDRARTSPGYNLFTNEVTQIYLIDNDGKLVHRWRVSYPYFKCEHAKLLEDGTLLVVCVDMGLVALDWDSHLKWELKMKVHHDVDLGPDGTIIVPYQTRESYQDRDVWFAGLLRLSQTGEILERWSSWEHLDELRKHHPPSPLDTPPGEGKDPLRKSLTGMDYYHLNSVEILPATPLGERDERFRAGNILISMRNTNLLLILDQDDYSVVWSWGPGEIELQHMPTMVPSGNILLFDNGTYRMWSRVIEIDPPTGKIVWEYKGDPLGVFFSKWRGSSQRLPNGNTLICESERGHVIEVTRDHEVVWEFWNPDLRFRSRKRIYRFIREPVEEIEPLLRKAGILPEKPPAG